MRDDSQVDKSGVYAGVTYRKRGDWGFDLSSDYGRTYRAVTKVELRRYLLQREVRWAVANAHAANPSWGGVTVNIYLGEGWWVGVGTPVQAQCKFEGGTIRYVPREDTYYLHVAVEQSN